jgi:hypothetical protein
MRSTKWIKLPDGTLARHKPDTLALFLADNEPFVRRAASPAPIAVTTSPSGSREPTYSTEAFDMGVLARQEVTVFGAGSVGSHVVYALGPAGLMINVIDPGIVQSRHTQGGRTIYDLTQVGLRKVYALKQKMERDFPGTIINALPYNTAEIPDSQIKSLLSRSLVAVLAIDDPDEILRISDMAYPITELVQPAMHAKGESGHITICAPFITPCLRCTLGIKGPTDIIRLDHERAAGVDIETVAHYAARVTLDIAYSKVTGQPITRWDTAKNLIYIANTKQDISQDGPGLTFESSRKRPGCSVCDSSYGRMKGFYNE